MTGLLFDTINPAPDIADTSLAAWDRILPSLTQREFEVFLSIWDYLDAHPQYSDVTGGELAAWSHRLITSVRPRITGLIDRGLLASGATRKSRERLEGVCHPVWPLVPREAIERANTPRKSEDGRG